MRKAGLNRFVLYAAALTAVFSLAFFLGRNTVPFEASVSVQHPVNAERSVPVDLSETETAETVMAPIENLTSVADERSLSVQPEPSALDLNRATEEELMTLPGIGETLAQRILEYRENVGHFTAPEQIMDVEGIGKGIYEKICHQITVEEPQ